MYITTNIMKNLDGYKMLDSWLFAFDFKTSQSKYFSHDTMSLGFLVGKCEWMPSK